MLFNGGTIPWYITVKNYGLIDSIWALVLGGSLPVFNLILMMNFFRGIPRDLEEAAFVDGAGPWRILFTIVVPCSIPVIATIVLFTGVYHWNEFFQGLVLTTNESRYPLQTYIQQLVVNIQASTLSKDMIENLFKLSNKSLNAAKVFIAMIPMLVVYPFLQRYFISGIMLGAVKE
jgi:multiple sugar transport system permease protein/putative aldouronate transport system permease protein